MGTIISSCTTTSDEQASYGIQPAYRSFVPARISVMPCHRWPDSLPLSRGVANNASALISGQLCKAFDQFVLDSFTDQPYMNGFTPKLVRKMIDRSDDQPDFMADIDRLWATNINLKKCHYCTEPSLVYQRQLVSYKPWLLWLQHLSEQTKYSDAALFPLITTAHEGQKDDRGLLESKRYLSALLLLIDTNTGKIIWSGHRASTINTKAIRDDQQTKFPLLPEWQLVLKNIFIEQLWEGFPGRITY